MKSLPKDLAAQRDEYFNNVKCNGMICDNDKFDAGATAVLEHEQIKKLMEALDKCTDAHLRDGRYIDVAEKALAEYRAWVSSTDVEDK